MEKRLPVIGDIVKTSYSDRKYEVFDVSGPCDCPSFHAVLQESFDNPAPRSKEHYHFVVLDENRKKAYLNGYALSDGKIKSVWSDDELFIVEPVEKYQLELF
jgi:hypothetical protein